MEATVAPALLPGRIPHTCDLDLLLLLSLLCEHDYHHFHALLLVTFTLRLGFLSELPFLAFTLKATLARS